MNKGEVWALQWTKKPAGLCLSVLTIKLKQTNKQDSVYIFSSLHLFVVDLRIYIYIFIDYYYYVEN